MLPHPGLAKLNKILLFVILISVVLYFGRQFFVLISFAGLLAMLMTPMSNKLESRGVSRILSSVICVLIIVTIFSGIILLLYAQISSIGKELPIVLLRYEEIKLEIQALINDSLGVTTQQLHVNSSNVFRNAGSLLTDMVMSTFTFVGSVFLVMVFIFLFLMQRNKYENFVVRLYNEDKRAEAKEMVDKISQVAQQYLTGRLIAALIMGILFFIGFIIIGLKNAIVLSLVVAVMTIIPYVGALIGGLVPFFISIIDGSIDQSIWVIIIVLLVNVIDHYFIEPYVVGGSVNISPFFTIFVLILGGLIWGIAGIILFLPLSGILKIIFENVQGLEPYASLIGDQSDSSEHQNIFSKFKSWIYLRKKRE
ncbi:MAG: AI-2E family transporter [Bacteroidales bacterium]|nr:AI-2E family transporter [Bacteroidales bacterium]